MSSRFHLIAVSALLLASLCGSATFANAGPQGLETCESGKRVHRSVGHPGKSAMFPQRESTQCSRPARKRLTLATFVDAPGGSSLVSGRTKRALEQIYAKGAVPVSYQTLTNLCVAHTVQRQFDEARQSCDAAVTSATAKRASRRYQPDTTRKQLDAGAAVAYSNRAVMHLLARDTEAAQNDLASARAIAPRAFYVMRNLDAAMPTATLAQASYAYHVSIR